jgi:hypothetical protein
VVAMWSPAERGSIRDGGRSISNLTVLRDQPTLFGPVASTATAWRVLDRIDPAALGRVRAARATAREQLWAQRAETAGPVGGHLTERLELVARVVTLFPVVVRDDEPCRLLSSISYTPCCVIWSPAAPTPT